MSELAMYKADLDFALARGCSNPGCTHEHVVQGIFLEPRCHTGGGLDVAYLGGTLRLSCHVCDQELVSIVVANEEH